MPRLGVIFGFGYRRGEERKERTGSSIVPEGKRKRSKRGISLWKIPSRQGFSRPVKLSKVRCIRLARKA